MKPTQIAAVLGAAVLLAGAIAPISAQDSKDRTVEQYSCKDIMRRRWVINRWGHRVWRWTRVCY